MPKHNHITRDIKPQGQCPGCDEASDLACSWSDYRSDYGVDAHELTAAHKAFKAGWKAAREGDQSGVLR